MFATAFVWLLAASLVHAPFDADAAGRLGGFELISARGLTASPGALRGDAGCAGSSSSGRFVVFWSTDDYISPGGDPSTANLFIRDRLTATTTLVLYKNPLDAQGNRLGEADEVDFADCPAVSDDGRYVLFVTQAKLTSTDRFLCEDVYLHDRATGTTRLLNSTSTEGGLYPALSAAGRYAAYIDGVLGLVRHDLLTGHVQQVPSYANWGQSSGRGPLAISASGRFIAFQSESSLGPDATPLIVYLADMSTGGVLAVSRSDGSDGAPFKVAMEPSVSDDGRRVAFSAILFPERYSATFVRDIPTGRTSLISRRSRTPQLSGDGRHVAFISELSNLSRYDGPGEDLFLRDLQAGETALVTKRKRPGRQRNSIDFPLITDVGDSILFTAGNSRSSDDSRRGPRRVVARMLAASGRLDIEAPELRVTSRYQRRRGRIALRMRCNESCRLKGTVAFRSRMLGSRSIVRALHGSTLSRGKVRALSLALPTRLDRPGRRSAVTPMPVRATVRVQGRDRVGNRERLTHRFLFLAR